MKTRFSPSPTGLLHLGNIRTAVLSYLASKAQQGAFLLRIEDTDPERSKVEFSEQLMADLNWLGIDWDEGPFYQSQRQARYDKYYQILEQKGQAYPCFCSEQQLAVSRKVQLTQGRPPRYAGTCRNLSSEEVAQKIEQGLKPTLRFKVPDDEVIAFVDFVRGEQRFNSSDIGDFIIRRANGTSPFMYCSVIDDALMGVTHVMRGEDHITNTPRQLMVLNALGLDEPQYGHISLIVGQDGSPLSKRHGSRSIKQLRAEGFLAAAIINYLARLGHYYQCNDLMTMEQLAAGFKVTNLGKAPARYDEQQLLHWQKTAVMALDKEQCSAWLQEVLTEYVPPALHDAFVDCVRENIILPQDAADFAQGIFKSPLEFNDKQWALLQQAGVDFFNAAIAAVTEHGAASKPVLDTLKQVTGKKGKALFQPVRVAISAQEHGPELSKVMQLIGKEALIERLQQVLTKVETC